jgi:hypothetical protein
VLKDGFGNRFNHIFNFLHKIDDVIFIWHKRTGYNSQNCTWEDLFSFPKLNIIYTEDLTCYKEKNVVCFNFKDPQNNHWAYYMHENNREHNILVKNFIDSLVPTKQVLNEMVTLNNVVDGHVVRSLHPNSVIGQTPSIIIPKGDFLTSDSKWSYQINSSALFKTRKRPPKYLSKHHADSHVTLRSKQASISAIADWLTLFKCNIIYEYGLYFTNYSDSKHTTFIDAHRIYGKSVINRTHIYDITINNSLK